MSSRKPEMRGILEDSRAKTREQRSTSRFKAISAGALALGIVVLFFTTVLNMGSFLASHPQLRPFQGLLFPVAAVLMLLAVLPLIFYLSFQEEFGNVNPLLPTHYAFLVRRALKAIGSNDFKVSAKDI